MSSVDLDTGPDTLHTALGILRQIQRDYQDEQHRVEDWFEVEDREMHAYHQGKCLRLQFCIQALETNLKLAGAMPGSGNGPSPHADPVLAGRSAWE